MAVSKFCIRETASGYKFDLRSANGQVILTSEVYTSRAAARKGAASVRLIAPVAPLENRTEEPIQPQPNPKFELYQDKAGAYRFRLRSRNGAIVAASEAYSTKNGCLEGIESVRKNANFAENAIFYPNKY